MKKVDFVFIVGGVIAAIWIAADLMRPPPPGLNPRAKAGAQSVTPASASTYGSAPISRAGSQAATPTVPSIIVSSPILSKSAELAIDPFADGGPAVVVVHPEPPTPSVLTEERDDTVLVGEAQ